MVKDRFSEKDFEHEVYPIADEIEELLPTRKGFFFGGTEYDEYYLGEIEETIKIINKCLELSEDWEFRYQSSW